MSDQTEYEVDAETLARAWLAVFTATSEDHERPILCRTVAIELWPDGVRLTACDSYMIWTAWVPRSSSKAILEPTMGELPETVVVAFDEDYRGRDLLKFAYKIVTAKDAAPQRVKLTIGPAPLQNGQFPGTELDAVSLSFPADASIGDRVVLGTIEGVYPEWRSLIAGKASKKTDKVCLSPELLSRVASIKRYFGEPLTLTFTGGVVLLEPFPSLGPLVNLLGGVMPVRDRDGGPYA